MGNSNKKKTKKINPTNKTANHDCARMMRNQLPDHPQASHASRKSRIHHGEGEVLLFCGRLVARARQTTVILRLWVTAAVTVLCRRLWRNAKKLSSEVTYLPIVDTTAIVRFTAGTVYMPQALLILQFLSLLLHTYIFVYVRQKSI